MTDRVKTKRRRIQLAISVRMLMVAVLVTAVGLSWQVQRARPQRLAMEAIRRIGGSLTFHHQMVNGKYDEDAEPACPRWLRKRVGQEYFVEVVGVNLCGRPITDAELAPFLDLRHLHELAAHRTRVTDAGLAKLDRLSGLEWLDFRRRQSPTQGSGTYADWRTYES